MRHAIATTLSARGPLIRAFIAAPCILTACTPNPGATPASSSSPASGSPKPAASASASSAPASVSAGTMTLKSNGEDVGLKGNVLPLITQNSGMLTFSRGTVVGPTDPENPVSRTDVKLIFEKTKGIKPFVLPTVKNSQERRCEVSTNGIIAYSSMTVSEDVSDTFAYKDGRVTGTWVFKAPYGAPTAAKTEFELTVDVEIPAGLR